MPTKLNTMGNSKPPGGSQDSIDSTSTSASSLSILLSTLWIQLIRPLIPATPLALVLVLLIGATPLALSLSTWSLLFHSSQHNAVVFAQDAQREVLSKAVADLQVRIDTAERLVRMQRAEWHHGVLNVTTPERKDQAMRHLLDTLVMYKELVAAYYYTTWPAGRINGWYTAQNSDTGEFEYQIWETTDVGDYRVQAVDPESMQPYGDLQFEEVDYSVADSLWVTQVLPARPRAPPSWTRAYGFEGGLWLSLSQAGFAGPEGEFSVVASVDFDLTFMSNVLQAFMERNQNGWSTPASNMTLYLLEAATDTVIGSSLPTNVVLTLDVDGNERTIGIAELAAIDTRMAGVTAYIRSQNSRLAARPTWSFRIDGHFVETRIVTSSYPTSNLKWVLVQLVPDELVDKLIHSNTEYVAATTGTVVGLAFVIGGACAYFMSRQIWGVVRDLRLLAELDFASLLDLYGGIVQRFQAEDGEWETRVGGSKSWVKEIWHVQRATMRLVVSLVAAAQGGMNREGGEEEDLGSIDCLAGGGSGAGDSRGSRYRVDRQRSRNQ